MREELRLLSAGAAQGLVEAIRAPFRAASGAEIDATFGAVGALAEKLEAGERCDVVILTAAMIADLERNGRALRGTSAPLGRVRTGVAVRAGDPLPAIGERAAACGRVARRARCLCSRHRSLDRRHSRRRCAAPPRSRRRARAALVDSSERRDGDARARRRERARRDRLHADHRDSLHVGNYAGRPAAGGVRARDRLFGGRVGSGARTPRSRSNSRRCRGPRQPRAAGGAGFDNERTAGGQRHRARGPWLEEDVGALRRPRGERARQCARRAAGWKR